MLSMIIIIIVSIIISKVSTLFQIIQKLKYLYFLQQNKLKGSSQNFVEHA